MAAPDMEVIKDIPGYKVILKAILKTQIQMLVEQLATHTDEESVILTASVADGTLSHLGSDSGKSFLDDNEDVKSQFLGFCLKRHHKRKLEEKQREEQEALQAALSVQPRLGLGPSPRRVMRGGYRMATPRHPGLSPGAQMPTPGIRHEPYPVTRPQRSNSLSSLDSSAMNLSSGMNASGMPVIKTEPSDSESNPQNAQDKDNNTSQPQTNNEDSSSNSAFQNEQSNTAHASDSDSGMDPNVSVKLEAMNEDDLELEITGVEPGQIPSVAEMQMQNMSMDQSFLTGGAAGSQADVMGQGFNLQELMMKAAKRYRCEVCGKLYTTKQNMETHMRLHSGDKPFKCSKCSKRFNSNWNLKSHMLTHMKL